jgi:hypothetical protein
VNEEVIKAFAENLKLKPKNLKLEAGFTGKVRINLPGPG